MYVLQIMNAINLPFTIVYNYLFFKHKQNNNYILNMPYVDHRTLLLVITGINI